MNLDARYLKRFGASCANPHAIYSTLEPNVQIRTLFTTLWSFMCKYVRYLQHFGAQCAGLLGPPRELAPAQGPSEGVGVVVLAIAKAVALVTSGVGDAIGVS